MFATLNNKTKLLLGVIIILGGIVRFAGANPGFNQYHSDEGVTYSAAVSMILNGNLDPLRYDYPALVPEINYLAFKTIFIPLYWVKYYVSHLPQILDGLVKLPLSKDEYKAVFHHDILGDREVNALFWGRYTTAFVSTLSIGLIFVLGKRMFSENVGLFAAFLLAFNFRSVTNSHIGLPDTYNAFFLLLSLISIYRLKIDSSVRSYLLAGMMMGLSLATKYQTFILFPFLFMHFFKDGTFLSINAKIKAFFNRKLYIGLLTAVITFLAVNPYLLINLHEAMTMISSVSTKYAMGKDSLMLFPFHYWLFIDYGPFLAGLIALGLVLSFIKKRFESVFLLGEIAPFLFVMLYYSVGGFYVRNFITITPLFLLFASYLLFKIGTVLKSYQTTLGFLLMTLILVIASALPLHNIYIHTINYAKEWNYKTIIAEARDVLPSKSIVVGHPFDPLPGDKEYIRIPISTAELYSLAEFRTVKADYAYINLDWAADPFYGWMTSEFPRNASYVLRKPYLEMRETYWGLTIEEMMHFVSGSNYKPWQAPEAALFIVKVPQFEKTEFKPLETYYFTESDEGWVKEDAEDSISSFLSYSSPKKAIQIGPGNGLFNITRYSSPTSSVKEGFLYQVNAVVSADKPIASRERNIFLRMNFYDHDNNKVYTSVSERFWKAGEPLTFIAQAPKEANSVTISIEASNAVSSPVYLKQVILSESANAQAFPSTQRVPYTEYKDILYPNSHGNL